MFHALTFDGLNGIMTKKNLDIRAGYRKREYDTRKVYLGTVWTHYHRDDKRSYKCYISGPTSNCNLTYTYLHQSFMAP